ncbi:hypothetical protein [Streptomyces sp. NPDC002573]|uniref:hypothetical protein n=1 Tax=Streptomyces sp. NPDC002573 TaxID=3364651 RepID=UPI0036A89BED
MTTVIGPGAAGAHAASDIPLPIAHFAHMVVDAPHGHLFISGGAGTDGILVTDLDGGNPTTIGGEPGATGLALSDDGSLLYAALPDQDTIAAISTEKLTESARYATGAGTRPQSPVVAGGTLWFGYGTAGAGGIGSVDGSGTVTLRQDSGSWAGPPTLATTPTPSGVLAAARCRRTPPRPPRPPPIERAGTDQGGQHGGPGSRPGPSASSGVTGRERIGIGPS